MLTNIHAELLSLSLNKLLGKPLEGNIAFLRCLDPSIVRQICASPAFSLSEWDFFGVVDRANKDNSLITADMAVEIREGKKDAVLFLIDVNAAGAGMDGIYNSGREIGEKELFDVANKEALSRVPRGFKDFVKKAVSKSRRLGGNTTISPWREFDYLSSCIDIKAVSRSLAKLGLWPIEFCTKPDLKDIDTSVLLVERLFLQGSSSVTAEAKVEALMLREPTEKQKLDLIRSIRESAGVPLLEAASRLVELPHLWVNSIHPFPSDSLQKIETISWRGKTGKPTSWSGLKIDEDEDRLSLTLDPTIIGRNQPKLGVYWNGLPDTLHKGVVEYSVAVLSGDEELAEKRITHSGKNPQKCAFTLDDFEFDESAKFEAIVRIRAVGTEGIEEYTEDFLLMFGEVIETPTSGAGQVFRTLVEGAIMLENHEEYEAACKNEKTFGRDSKGFVTFRYKGDSKKVCNAKIYCPVLLRTIEEDWGKRNGDIGRWFIRVRSDGSPVGEPEFMSYAYDVTDRLKKASIELSKHALRSHGIVGMIHGLHKTEEEFLLAWQNELESGNPILALQNTLEVRTLSGATVGLIVLPFHPLRFAWHFAYDQLLTWYRYEQGLSPNKIRETLKTLDGAHFPAFLPGLNGGESYVFGDTLGFHAVAMVSDTDREPKASIAILAKVLAGGKDEIAPSIGKTTSDILAAEIYRYLKLHPEYNLVSVHALRPGDGMTIGRALGAAIEKHKMLNSKDNYDETTESPISDVSFKLDLYPSRHREGVCGRFFSNIIERKRSGAGSLLDEDRWMLELCPRDGEVTVPKLFWAKRNREQPEFSAHLSVAFDTFDSRVITTKVESLENAPLEVFGLSNNLIRKFSFEPQPVWQTYLSPKMTGERHPAAPILTDRITKLHTFIMSATATNLGSFDEWPILRTEIASDKEDSIENLHRLSDWVITIDRNAGLEYFDSPNEKNTVYDAYIIDCVPEREDLGFLQMVTSTSNFDEVRKLLDQTLAEMELSSSPRNCLFLLNELKALSGRFAMRLVGAGNQPQEMVALAMTHSVSRQITFDDDHWPSLQEGFFVPIDDVPEIFGTDLQDEDKSRADLLYVTVPRRGGGLRFNFVEIKFRRNLKTARSNDLIDAIMRQLQSSRKKWNDLYGAELTSLEKAIRRSWLARVLRFYAAKGLRHYLSEEAHQRISRELDKMVREGENYNFPCFGDEEASDRGFIFCPEYIADEAARITSNDQIAIFLFGANEMPDPPIRGRNKQLIDNMEQDTMQPLVTEETPIQQSQEDTSVKSNAEVKQFDSSSFSKQQPSSGQISNEQKKTDEGVPFTTETPIILGHEIANQEGVNWKISIKTNPHLMIVGLPGMGKTTSLINICLQMVEQGIMPIIFSYHDDIDDKLTHILGKDITFTDYAGLGFNPLRVVSDSKIAYIDNVSMLRDIFSSIFPDLGDIQLGRIREALKQSYLDKGWGDTNRERASLDFPEFHAFYDYLKATTKNDKTDKGLLTRLDELNDYGFFSTSAGDRSLLGAEKPAIIRIHNTQNEVLQQAFATFVLHNLYQQMFVRGVQQQISHAIIFDEAHRAAKLKLIPTMAKECRKYGIAFVLASQEVKDFDPSLFNAIANYLSLRLNETDAKVMAKIIANSDQVNRFTDKIKQMPKYHALFFGEGKSRASFLELMSQKTQL